jgi:chemotaxis signal transduction protein
MSAPTASFDNPYVIARADDALLAIPASWATEMFVCTDVSGVPMAPAHVRGVMVRRGRSITLIDARTRLGSVNRRTENARIVELLHAREADHVRWVDTLLECIRSGTEFLLARDPSQCAFGKWFDSYLPPTLALKRQLARFSEPHAAIHALAAQAEQLATGDRDQAVALIEHHRSYTLDYMRTLFAETRTMVTNDVREIVIAHDDGHHLSGLIVDDIEAVERLRPDSLISLDGTVPGGDDSLVRHSARTARDQVVLLPDIEDLMGLPTDAVKPG